MLETLWRLRSELEAAIAKDDVGRVLRLLDFCVRLGNKLDRAVCEGIAMMKKAMTANNRRLMRELDDKADELSVCLTEWMLIAGKFIVYLTQSESADSGGGSRSRRARTASSVWEKRLHA
jgi:hypothetical protein